MNNFSPASDGSPKIERASEVPPRGKSFSWASGVAIALLLYVLSIGPIIALADKGVLPVSVNTLRKFYTPLVWCVNNFDHATETRIPRDCIWWYLEFCGYEFDILKQSPL